MIFIKRFIQTCLLIPVFLILHINWSLHYTPNCDSNVNQDVFNQLNYLGESMKKDGIDAQMQAYFPEGYFFTNVLYGLAWCDVLKSADKQTPLFKRGVGEIEWSIGKLNSEEGKRIFNAQSPLPYGAFYNGPAASVVAIKAMSENQDFALHASIRNAIEAFGFSINWDDSKFYLGKQLPVADAFIAWCNAQNCLNSSQKMSFPWLFHLISLLIVVPFCWWIYKL